MDDKTFAEQLKAARKATGLSQQGMADRMLISKRTIEKWEIGETGDGRTPPPYVQRFVLNELQDIAKNKEAKENTTMTRAEIIKALEEADRLLLEEIGADELTDRAREKAHIDIRDAIEQLAENYE